MMKVWTISLITVFVATAYGAQKKTVPSPRHSVTPDEQLQRYMSASYRVKGACQKFQAQSQALMKNQNLKKPLPWGNQSQALVKLLETYPGNAKEYAEAIQLVRKTPQPDKKFKVEHLSGFYTCPTMAYYSVARKLIASLPKFPKDKQNVVVSQIVKVAERELSTPGSFTEVFLQANLIKNLAATGVSKSLAAEKPEIEKLMKNTRALNHDLTVARSKSRTQTFTQWWRENSYAMQTGSTWIGLLKKARL